MGLPNRHMIQKQVIEVEMENPLDAFAFRNRLGELYYQQIVPRLESVFDEIGGRTKLIRQDHLEIDLGTIPSENWEEVFVEAAVRKIKEELLLARTISLNDDTSGTQELWIGKGQVGELALIKKHHTVEEILDFFLNHGFFPWYGGGDFNLDKELAVWLEQSAASAKQYFQQLVANEDKQVLQRLVYRFDERILNSIIGLVLENASLGPFKEILRYKTIFKTFLASFSISTSEIKRIIYLPLFQPAGGNFAVAYLKRFFSEIQRQVPSVSFFVIKNNLKVVLKEHVLNEELSMVLSAIDRVLPATEKEVKQVSVNNQEAGKAEESIYISNAGLVILQPFLLPFFSHIGLTDGNNHFKTERLHQKAVLLSQYLVAGTVEINEEEVLLNKILCGYPVQEALANELMISDDERNEAHDLLVQIIGLWKMKGIPVNNTIEGLRQSFLQREGKLTPQENDWHLQVEQKPYDMVFSSLPWSISIIKNSWMEGKLWVEWT